MVEWAERYADFMVDYQPPYAAAGRGAALAAARRAVRGDGFRVEVGGALAVFSPLAFDSRLFGLAMGRVDFACGAGADAAGCLAELVRRAKAEGIEHLFYRVPSRAVDWVAAAQLAGFSVVTNNIYFARKLEGGAAMAAVRAAREEDRPRLLEITRQAFAGGTRFHLDPALDPAAAVHLHEEWCENCLRGERADAVLVCDEGGAAAGYITCQLLPEWSEDMGIAVAEIGLLAVGASRQGRGVGRKLVDAALVWCRDRGAQKVLVDTESINNAAINCYVGAGFKVCDSQYSMYAAWPGTAV